MNQSLKQLNTKRKSQTPGAYAKLLKLAKALEPRLYGKYTDKGQLNIFRRKKNG